MRASSLFGFFSRRFWPYLTDHGSPDFSYRSQDSQIGVVLDLGIPINEQLMDLRQFTLHSVTPLDELIPPTPLAILRGFKSGEYSSWVQTAWQRCKALNAQTSHVHLGRESEACVGGHRQLKGPGIHRHLRM